MSKNLIIILSFVGLLLLSTNSFKRKPRKEFFFYFTNLSNLFIFIYHLYDFNNEIVHFSLTLYLLITFSIFNFIILPYGRKNKIKLKDIGTTKLVAFILHDLVPLLSVVNWFFSNPNLTYRAVIYSLIFPILYSFFCIFIGKSGYIVKENPTNYIYPFFDIDKLGLKKVLLIILGLLLFVVALGISLIYLNIII